MQHIERPPQTQQPKQDEKAEKYSAGKGNYKSPPNQTKEEEIGSLTERIQDNDSKNDPKFLKQNGVTDTQFADKD